MSEPILTIGFPNTYILVKDGNGEFEQNTITTDPEKLVRWNAQIAQALKELSRYEKQSNTIDHK